MSSLTPKNNKTTIHLISDDEKVPSGESSCARGATLTASSSLVESECSTSYSPSTEAEDDVVVLVNREAHVYAFVRVLMKYLEAKHPLLYVRAKAIVIDCALMKKQQQQVVIHNEQANRKAVTQMVNRLRGIVSEQQWELANNYTYMFLKRSEFGMSPKRLARRRHIPVVEP